MKALELEKVKLPISDSVDLFLMYVNEEEKQYALYLAQELRMAGFVVETEYTGRSLKAQFKQADRLNAKFTCVLNSEDLNNNEVKIKNNKTKEEEIISLDVLLYYLDEQLGSESDDDCDCGCGCGDDCHCGDDCDCGCQEGKECTCGCGCGDDCQCGDDCDCGCHEGKKCNCHDKEK